MPNILAIGASNNSQSINKELANYVAHQIKDAQVNLLDLNDFDLPIYNPDWDKENGIPEAAHRFKDQITNADAIVVSLAEYNGSFTPVFKNIYDWASRFDQNVWQSKPIILLATSPGGRGAIGVLEHAATIYSFWNKKIAGKLSVPSFYDNYDKEKGLINSELKSQLDDIIEKLESFLISETV